MTLSKSLQELDAYADELLKSEKGSEELKPEDVAQETPDTNAEGEKSPTGEEAPPAEEKEPEGKEEKVEKSEDVEPVGDDEPTADEPSRDELEKSIHNEMLDDNTVQKSVEASEFLQSIVSILSKSMADAAFETQLLQNMTADSSDVLAKSLQASLALNKSMAVQLEEVQSQNETLKKSVEELNGNVANISSLLEEISHQPAGMRKSVSNIQTLDRNFQKSINGTDSNPLEALSKSEILGTLNQELYSGNTLVTPTDIISYESGAPLRPELVSLVRSKLK